jgi:hypothetical protein
MQEGYTPKQGHVPGGVCHKNVAHGYGARLGIIWAQGCVWEGSCDYVRSDCDSGSRY